MQEWWNGRHEGLKILWPLPAVWVRVPLPVQEWLITMLLSAIYNFQGSQMIAKIVANINPSLLLVVI